jgi:hypothetical protein
LEIKRMNDKLDGYSLSFEAATVSEMQAERRRKNMEFSKKFGAALGSLSEDECNAILEANKKWTMTDKRLMDQMNELLAQMRATSLESGGKRAKSDTESEDSEKSEPDGETKSSGFKNPFGGDKLAGLTKKLSKLTADRAAAEDAYLQTVGAALPKARRESLMKLLSDPREIAGWQMNADVLALNPETDQNSKIKKKHVFVLNFFGDVRASQAEQLREEVTGLLRSAKKERGDEVVLRLNTGGGTVTGYGLAAAQLMRIKDAGLKLTICVEQVAASGGYMMACVADEIVASPFAVLGSIGVISEQPNVYERLQREGIEFQTVTAGKFKRTLTPTKKVTRKTWKSQRRTSKTFWCSSRVLSPKIDRLWTLTTSRRARRGLAKMRCREIWWTNSKRLTMSFSTSSALAPKFLASSLSNRRRRRHYLVVRALMRRRGNGIFCNAWHSAWPITPDRPRPREE